MLPLLTLHLLDVLEIWDAAGELLARLPTGKGAELLALLAYRPSGLPRAEAATLLWPDAPETTARHRLRTLILEVGHRYDGVLQIARDRVGLASGVAAPVDRPGVFAPGLEAEWLEEARADLAYRLSSRLVLQAQEQVSEDPLGAVNLAEQALRLVPESLAAQALLSQLRNRTRAIEVETASYLSVRDRARLAIAKAPVRHATGDLRGPRGEVDWLLGALGDDPSLRAGLLIARAGYLYEEGDYPGSRRDAIYAVASERRDARAGPSETAWAHFWLARCGYSTGDFTEALTQARIVVKSARECGETNLVVLAESLLAAAELLRGRPERIEDHLGRARAAADEDPYLTARWKNVAGWGALTSGASARAIRFFEAARLGGAPDLRLVTNALQGLARAHEMAGDRETARQLLEETIRLLEGTEFDVILVGVLAALADLDEADGRYEAALALHRRGLERRTGAGNRLGLFTSLVGIGRLSLKLGRAREAVRHLREAYALHTTILGEVRLPIAALPLAEALIVSGRTREATTLVVRSIEILENEAPEVRAGNSYPAEIPILAERLAQSLGL